MLFSSKWAQLEDYVSDLTMWRTSLQAFTLISALMFVWKDFQLTGTISYAFSEFWFLIIFRDCVFSTAVFFKWPFLYLMHQQIPFSASRDSRFVISLNWVGNSLHVRTACNLSSKCWTQVFTFPLQWALEVKKLAQQSWAMDLKLLVVYSYTQRV